MTKNLALFSPVISSVTNIRQQFLSVHKVFWRLLWSNKINSFWPERLKTQIFRKKRQPLQWRKKFWPNFPALSNMTDVGGEITRVKNVFWNLLWKWRNQFFRTLDVVENTCFREKKATFSMKKHKVAYFFSYYRTGQRSRNSLWGSQRSFDNDCAHDKIIYSGPKRPIEKHFKEELFSPSQKFLAHFLSYYREWQTSRNPSQGSTSIFYFCCISCKRILLRTKRLLNTPFFKKNQTFKWWKGFRLIFPVRSSITEVGERLIRVHKVFWHLLCKW